MKSTELMRSWIGKNERDGSHRDIVDIYNSHKPYARGVKATYDMAWCAITISAMAIELDLTDIIPTEVGCERQIELFMALGSWVENDSYTPKEGDIIYYDWQDTGVGDNTGWSDHVGYVASVDKSNIEVIEGNYNDAVRVRNIKVNARYIRGYGVPNYPVESVLADDPEINVDSIIDFVERLYNTALNRSSDKAGMDNWVNNIVAGVVSPSETAKSFINSKEFKNRDTSNEDYIEILYDVFFDRNPDEAGYYYWLNMLNEGTNREIVLDGFIYSAEWAEVLKSYQLSK